MCVFLLMQPRPKRKTELIHHCVNQKRGENGKIIHDSVARRCVAVSLIEVCSIRWSLNRLWVDYRLNHLSGEKIKRTLFIFFMLSTLVSDGKIISLHMSRIRCYELYPTWKILTITKPDVSV